MQTITTEHTKPTTDLDDRIARSETEANKLREAASRAEKVSERALAAYKAERTREHLLESQLAADKASDANEIAKTYEETTLAPLRAEQKKRRDDARRAEIQQRTELNLVMDPVNRIEAAIEHCVAEFDAALSDFGKVCAERRELAVEAGALGVNLQSVSFEFLIQKLSEKLRAKHTKQASGGADDLMLIVGGLPNLRLHLSRPAPIPSHSIR